MRVYLVFWLSGLLAGVILVERWRRNGEVSVPVVGTAAGQVLMEASVGDMMTIG